LELLPQLLNQNCKDLQPKFAQGFTYTLNIQVGSKLQKKNVCKQWLFYACNLSGSGSFLRLADSVFRGQKNQRFSGIG